MHAQRFNFRHAALALTLGLSSLSPGMAQTLPDPVPDDFYRAEVMILERLDAAENLNERMAQKAVEPPVNTGTNLWVEPEAGARVSDLNLLPSHSLHLSQAARRLERSGRYQVLATAAWYEGFPPDHDTGPMRVVLGDWLPDAQQREIDGHIQIERRRYLHVNVHLNHWTVNEEALAEANTRNRPDESTHTDRAPVNTDEATTAGTEEESAAQASAALAPAPVVDPQLLTWIRETRRMRSGEVHFIDSPTIGVLVYFEPIEPE